MSIGRAIGPLYGGLIIDHFNYEILFLTVSLMMFLTLIIVAFLTRSKKIKNLVEKGCVFLTYDIIIDIKRN